MDKRELAFAKQTILGVKEWDNFQQALRFYARMIRPVLRQVSTCQKKQV